MQNSKFTTAFLNSLELKTKNEILLNIAKHYGITIDEAYNEITDADAENIMDYITGPIRSAVSILYYRFSLKF